MDTANLKPGRAARSVEQKTRRAANNPALIFLGRFGYAARGVVYIIIGLLAALAALGNGGTTTDRKGAVETIYHQPFGQVLLGLVTIGLVGYAIWKFIAAIADTQGKGHEPKGIASRLVYVGIGVSYATLALAALQLLLGSGNTGKSSDNNAQDWTAKLLQQPFGVILVIIIALVVLGVSGFQFYQAYKAKFKKHLELGQMAGSAQEWTVRFGRFGYAARGVVFGIVGIFLIVAALQKNPGQAKGLGGALQELSQQPYGQVLLGVVAIGLIAFGLFSLAEARYRRMVEAPATR